jgi:hypothetical protein
LFYQQYKVEIAMNMLLEDDPNVLVNGFVVEYSSDLNFFIICFPRIKCLHKVLADFEISGISITSSFLLILTRLSNFMCPIVLFQS